ncbi:hypothetical protein [Altererythrobacter sp. MTPC7]|uniref:hypothetical protein n=1 Tax=Altererythrobacter sp. MTPC7 TaxID=3056567 RepID=UPI0036F1FE37
MVSLPSRYEDLDHSFRGRLQPNKALIQETQRAFASMARSGGVRFLPIFGDSGIGKTSASLELNTHLPEVHVFQLTDEEIRDRFELVKRLNYERQHNPHKSLVCVVDQYEEDVARREDVPTAFVETISRLDRDRANSFKVLFLWLTTDQDFQSSLEQATSRNRRVLQSSGFEINGPPKEEWADIIEETFSFHNESRKLSDYDVLRGDIEKSAIDANSLGTAIEVVGKNLYKETPGLKDLSRYKVIMLWPVTDSTRIARIHQFVDAQRGYKLDWDSWYRELSDDDKSSLPLHAYNRARLYYDLRLVPIQAADLKDVCKDLDEKSPNIAASYLGHFKSTHFFNIVAGNWGSVKYAPLKERTSKRATEAKDWYQTVTRDPTKIGRRLAHTLNKLGLQAQHEKSIVSPHSKVRADVFIEDSVDNSDFIVEIKAYSTENTRPSSIRDAVRETMKRHAQLAGFMPRS